ncbi:hypothetical protein CLU81_0378 [Flavobacterium sp. 9]|uniref:hypothetical protein n=1 Tax=Flavobacterium sp. 9 TaxID=2035198 RepID=UPI000C18A4E5|nr:hypothetical protein [Flavobacterium sp. 9]PIF29992.1 hypothetical protein CLU81_0378 [Flavobacterium sp. 9]
MKKLRFLTFIVLLFASCNSNENPPIAEPLTFEPSLLLKTWTYDTVLLQGNLYLYDHNPDCFKDYFTYRNNEGQMYQYDEIYFTNTYCSGNQSILTWEPAGDHINFYFGTVIVDEYKVISLTEKLFTFAIDRDIDNDGKKEHLIITAIPYDIFNSSKIKDKKNQKLKTFPVKLNF